MALRTIEKTQASAKSLTRAKAVHVAAASTPAIPLNLAPLLASYRNHGRLALRFEHMPQTSRLSCGRNNGDRSWSVAEHELNDLKYHPPESMAESHELSVRVVGLDQDGATLAVLSVPIAIDSNVASFARQAVPSERTLPPSRVERDADRIGEIAALEKRTADRLEQARAQWQREAEETLERARAAWQADQGSQLASTELYWKEEIARVRADAAAQKNATSHAKVDLAPTPDPQALNRLREALASLNADLASRDAALADAHAQIATQTAAFENLRSEMARVQGEAAAKPDEAELQRLQLALASAESNLVRRDVELADAHAQNARQNTEALRLRAELARAQADASAKPDAGELRNSQVALAAAQTDLTRRDTDLANVRAQLTRQETEAESLRKELASAKAEAAAKHGADEFSRVQNALASAQAALADRDAELAGARVQIADRGEESARLRAEVATQAATIAGNESAMAGLRENLARSEQRWRKDSSDLLAKAKLDWEKSSASRLAAAESETRNVQSQCREMESQLRASEAVLADIRRRAAKAGAAGQESAEASALRAQLAMLQEALSERENDLAVLRTVPGENRRYMEDNRIVLHADRMMEALPEAPETKKAREFALSLVAFAIFTILGILYMPRLEAFLPYSWAYRIDSTMSDVRAKLGAQTAPAGAASANAAPAAALPRALLLRGAKLRAGPKASEHVKTTLQSGADVDVLDHSGNWTHVRATANDGTSQEGWVFSSYLTADNTKPK